MLLAIVQLNMNWMETRIIAAKVSIGNFVRRFQIFLIFWISLLFHNGILHNIYISLLKWIFKKHHIFIGKWYFVLQSHKELKVIKNVIKIEMVKKCLLQSIFYWPGFSPFPHYDKNSLHQLIYFIDQYFFIKKRLSVSESYWLLIFSLYSSLSLN